MTRKNRQSIKRMRDRLVELGKMVDRLEWRCREARSYLDESRYREACAEARTKVLEEFILRGELLRPPAPIIVEMPATADAAIDARRAGK